MIYITSDLIEEILLGLPLKSILRFKTVSKQWRSVLESEVFVQRRMNVQKDQKILAAYKCRCGVKPSLLPKSRFEVDEEIVYLHCNDAHTLMTCDGLVCLLESKGFIVLNPSTRQLLQFPYSLSSQNGRGVMGFGRDIVKGSYKVVKICVEPVEEECDVLNVGSGEWRKLKLPPYVLNVERKSACVNGSIYWLHIGNGYKILALDLHKEEFHNVSVPSTWVTRDTQLVNLGDRLAIANSTILPEWILEICTMDADREIWSKMCSISLAGLDSNLPVTRHIMTFTPVRVSKEGNLVFSNNHNHLFKYYSETNKVRCLSLDAFVISPYLENLAPLKSESGHRLDLYYPGCCQTIRCRLFCKHLDQCFRIFNFLKWVSFRIPKIVLLYTTVVTLSYILEVTLNLNDSDSSRVLLLFLSIMFLFDV